jgi:hypothetical protein
MGNGVIVGGECTCHSHRGNRPQASVAVQSDFPVQENGRENEIDRKRENNDNQKKNIRECDAARGVPRLTFIDNRTIPIEFEEDGEYRSRDASADNDDFWREGPGSC